MTNKKSWSERVNDRLRESPGEIFSRGKWRFWFALVFGLSLGSAIVTALIYAGSAGTLAIGMGVLVLWTLVGTLHYSDSDDPRLARGVSLLDSVALIFVVAHFCFVMWAYTHLLTLRVAEADYRAHVEAFNVKAEKIQADNVAIARSAERVATETTKAERERRRTAYHQRKAAEAGARIGGGPAGARPLSPALSTAPVELERPQAPGESSAAFLARWDAWIRIANFGELILAAVTLIYIRNRSAAYNSKNAPRALPGARVGAVATVPALRQGGKGIATAVATGGESDLERLRAHLKTISFYLPGRWFKVDPLEAGDGLWVRLCERRQGREVTIAKVKWNNKVFADLDRADFQTRLRQRLIDAGFPIGGRE